MNEHDLLWAMLPTGLEKYFMLEDHEKTEDHFRITLIEKNVVPADLPKEYQSKKVINNVLKPILIDFFPIMGRKTELILKCRWWKFEGVDKMYRMPIDLCAPGTKLEKEFADFLKEMDRI